MTHNREQCTPARRKILIDEMGKCYLLLHKSQHPAVFGLEIDELAQGIQEIPDEWLSNAFRGLRKDSPFLPSVSELLRVWSSSVRAVMVEQEERSRPKAGVVHDCPWCLVTAHRVSRHRPGGPAMPKLLVEEQARLDAEPSRGEILCHLGTLARMRNGMDEVAIRHWAPDNPYGLSAMDYRKGIDNARREMALARGRQ